VALPSGVRLVGGQASGSSEVGTWTVPPGSTLRLQQLLSQLGYLPLDFHGSAVARTTVAQEQAAIRPPSGSFSWRYANIPGALRNMWQAGTFGTMTRGAVMAFENDHGLATDGQPGPEVWKALIAANLSNRVSNFGYTFVMVNEGSPESLTLWHSGKTEFTVPVNTGIPSRPTALGTYPVFEHVPVTTMSGTNPDGSHYSDPGIPWVSYFNGGDALHGFLRAQYGFPQSLGCVEMNYADAARVYPFTPIGTLVNVS
jgi:peptidoglycan hydrolase-like protein with peptidoglycan-binding domain